MTHRHKGEDAAIRVAFINPGYGDRGFWKDTRDTMQAAADQFGFELVVFDSDRNWQKMIESSQKVFALDPAPDYIVAVNEYRLGARIVLEAAERNIPIIMLLDDLTDAQKNARGGLLRDLPNRLFSVTPDNERAGYEIARSLVDAARFENGGKVPDEICLLSIAGDNSTPASIKRTIGLDHALLQFSLLHEQRRLVANWSFGEAYRQTASWLSSGNCLEAVWAANDAMALGAITAIEKEGLIPGKDVFVGGLNWSTKGIQAVQDGRMTMTHGGHFMAGAWSMVLLHDYIAGVPNLIDHRDQTFRMEGITRQNAHQFADVLRTRDWHSIDFSAYSLIHAPLDAKYAFSLRNLKREP
ncbi:ABC transporter substrate-binding protein [Thalassospira sp. MA62]|nr:ABC transporter substrate-binding protein [Thalassospira sp. MA62]